VVEAVEKGATAVETAKRIGRVTVSVLLGVAFWLALFLSAIL